MAVREQTCCACDGTGKATRGWAGQPSTDSTTCPDCNGTGVDRTPFGTGMDSCPYCGADWRSSHTPGCVADPSM